jgi:predicted MFS family arabinose efflux permease
MLLSSSPLAFVVEQWGWRAGFWISAGFGVAVALAVYALVPNQRAEHADRSSPLSQMASVLRIGLSYRLRGLIAISLVSLAAVLVMRGLWGGPWLMEVKGLSRIEAGNALGLFTVALIVGPALIGIFDRRFGHRREVLAATHCLAALLLALMAAGAPHFPVSDLFGVAAMSARYDTILLVLLGLAMSAQPLVYGMTRQLVDAQNTGKALSAINLAFFLGAALMQSTSGVVATFLGLPAVLLFMAAALIIGIVVFLLYT